MMIRHTILHVSERTEIKMKKVFTLVIDENNEITIDFHIIVAYGVNIATIADNIISSVKYKIEEFTGMKVKKVNIYVEGVRTID